MQTAADLYAQGGATSAKGGPTSHNYRGATAKVDANYHLQSLLNKENKALQNLLAAVELNRTTAVAPGTLNEAATGGISVKSSIATAMGRATASAKQQ